MAFLGIKNAAEKQAIPILLEGYQELFRVQSNIKVKHAFDNLIDFFQATSKLQDNYEIIEAAFKGNKKMSEILRLFKEELRKSGREDNMNRSKRGETVTTHNTYLGGVRGLNTKTVDFWWNDKKYRDKNFKGEDSGVKLDYNPIYFQAEHFVAGFFRPGDDKALLTLIRKLLEALDQKL